MKKAVVIDAYSQGNYHEVVNQGYLMMISRLYDHVEYIAEAESCRNLQHLLHRTNADCKNVDFRPKNIRKRLFKPISAAKFWWFLKVSLLNYIYFMRTPKDVDVFFNNNLHLAILLIQWFSFGKKNRIFDLCHAELEMIDKREATTASRKFGSWIYRTAFCRHRLRRNMHFVLLSENMAEIFKSYILPCNHSQIHWMDHPYVRPLADSSAKTNEGGNILKVGIIGAITPQRGYDQIVKLLNLVDNNRIHLYTISFCSEEIAHDGITILNTSGKLSDYEEYAENIKNMDLVFLPYDKDSYRLTASGATLEAIWQVKPIISLRNQYLDYLFCRFGEIGILCDKTEEIATVLNSIDTIKIAKIKDNIRKARLQITPDAVCKQLKEITEQC